jgi:enoyl-CoA hydratase
MNSYKHFKTNIINNIVIAEFDNSEQRNCFGIACAKELQTIVKQISKQKRDGLIVTSQEKVFCSGGNLKDYAKLKKKSDGIKINREITKILNELESAPFPTICLVTGDCFGGGIEWISAFDMVFTVPHTLFGMWQRKIGLSFGWGGGVRLQKRLSHRELKNLILRAQNLSSYTALDINLIDAIYPKEIILNKALEQIKKLRDLPQIPFKAIKSLNSQFTNEQKVFESIWMNSEHQRLLSKFR